MLNNISDIRDKFSFAEQSQPTVSFA